MKTIKFKLDVTIAGDGSSLWAQKKESAQDFKITSAVLEGIDAETKDSIWTLELFGPKTKWIHYTDKMIEREVNKKLKCIVGKKIGHKVKVIGWSEQGMQPDDGWNFDVVLEKL